LVQDTEKLIELITKELASVHKTSDDPKMQKEAFKNLYTNMEGTLIYLDESIKSAEAKR